MKRICFGRSWFVRHALLEPEVKRHHGPRRGKRRGQAGTGPDNEVSVEPVVQVESVESCLNKVCILANITDSQESGTVGGVFISENGLIATCYHLLSDINDKVRVRLHTEKDWMDAKFVTGHSLWDVAIFSVVSDRKFGYVNVPNTINLGWGDPVVGFTHSVNSPFAVSSGFISYPFPDTVVLPEVSEPNRHVLQADRMECINGPVPCLKVRHYGPPYMLRTLPWIHVTSICGEPVTSGCPLFAEKTMEFIGLASHNHRAALCCLPSTLIPKLLSEVKKGTSSVGEGSFNVPAL